MTDIVERLRGWQNHRIPIEDLREAANEIERLVNEVNGYKHDVKRLLEGEDYLRYEIKRLQKTRRGLEEQQIEDRVEIGRLQTLVKKLGMPGF